jgi:hypothetical protein
MKDNITITLLVLVILAQVTLQFLTVRYFMTQLWTIELIAAQTINMGTMEKKK